MIELVPHESGGPAPGPYGDPAAVGPALAVARALHPPVPRAPEVAAGRGAARRDPAAASRTARNGHNGHNGGRSRARR